MRPGQQSGGHSHGGQAGLLGFLLVVVRLSDRLPTSVGRGFVGLLNAATVPVDSVGRVGFEPTT